MWLIKHQAQRQIHISITDWKNIRNRKRAKIEQARNKLRFKKT